MIFLFSKKGKAAAEKFHSGKRFLPFFCFFFTAVVFFSLFFTKTSLNAESPLPLIPFLDSRDFLFRQYQADVEAGRRLIFSPRRNSEQIAESLTIYSYIVREEDSLLRIAARANIPISTLASLNRLSNAEDLQTGRLLLLPSIPGIFVQENPVSELELFLSSARSEHNPAMLLSIPQEGRTERYMFFPGDDFYPAEYIFFLNRGFRFPLSDFRLSSPFGQRISPITGQMSHHRGIDLAAPEGSEVYSVRSGTVIDIGYDAVLGNYVMVEHDNNWVSLYGHLSSVNTSINSRLAAGSLLGRVGTTGLTTGPHLHFELIQNGQNQDPARLLGISTGQ